MLEIKNLNKAFGKRVLFENLNLEFKKNSTYAIIGSSGCGKSTLLNMIAKLEKADSGQIIFDGKDIKDIKDNAYFRDYLAILFQNFGLIENKDIRENLRLGLVGKKYRKNEEDKIFKDALRKVKLAYLSLDEKIYTLSGGEAQRLALARLILKDSPLILADEPTASVDKKNEDDIINLLTSLKNKKRIIIIASHSENVYKRCDHIIKIG